MDGVVSMNSCVVILRAAVVPVWNHMFHIVLLMVECDKIISDKVTQDNYRIKSLLT